SLAGPGHPEREEAFTNGKVKGQVEQDERRSPRANEGGRRAVPLLRPEGRNRAPHPQHRQEAHGPHLLRALKSRVLKDGSRFKVESGRLRIRRLNVATGRAAFPQL